MQLKQRFYKINKCIYCGSEEMPLTDEHVIPFALNGDMVLKDASCEKCRQITSKYERNPIRDNWTEARACLNYPSRKTNFNDKTFSLDVVLRDGTETTLNLNKGESLGIAHFPEFPLPAFLGNKNYKSGAVWTGFRTVGLGNVNLDDFVKKFNIKEIKGSVNYKENHFEIMIVRIAYCAAIAYLGPNALSKNFVLSTILGEIDDVGKWLGCDLTGKIIPHIGKTNSPNAIGLGLFNIEDKSYVSISIKFFAFYESPEYVVVIGEANQNALRIISELKS